MADSAISITSGTGTNVDTRTEATNGNHRQVIVLGDPATNAGVAPVDATAGLKVDLGADNDVTVSGVSTAANQSTIIGHLDGVETSLTSSDTSLNNIEAAVEILDNAISGSEMQVDVVGALPAGTNAIGKLAANSGVDIGDVDVTTVPADPFGANADAAATAGSTGSIQAKLRLMTSQLDAIKTSVETIDNTVSGSELQVDIVSGAGSGGTAIADDAAFTPGTTSVTPIGGILDNSGTDSVDEGDAGAVRMSANRNLFVNIRDNAGNERGLNIDSSGNATVNVTGTVTVASHAVTNAGTFAVQVDGNALTALQLIDDIVYTDDTSTHATGTSKGALFMAAATPTDTSVSANDIGAVAMTNDRKLHVSVQDSLPAGTNAIGKLLPPDIDVTAHTNYARKYYTNAGAVTDGIIWSPAAGKRWHVLWMYIQLSADATVTLEDDKAGGDDPVLKGEFKAGSGIIGPFPEKYPLASGEDAADLLITTSAGNVYVACVGYEI